MIDVPALIGLARSIVIYHGRPWRARSLRRFYAGLLRPGDLVFDVGAHVGNRSRALRAAGCRVVAFEPQPLFHRFLELTLAKRGVLLEAKAVGPRAGRMTLAVSRRHPTVSTLSAGWRRDVGGTAGFQGVAWDRNVEVDVVTLDGMIAHHGMPSFVKIDVEGFEADILDGLSVAVPTVAFEYLPDVKERALACIDRLAKLGDYRFNRVEGEETVFAEPVWRDAAAMRGIIAAMPPGGRSGDVYARVGA